MVFGIALDWYTKKPFYGYIQLASLMWPVEFTKGCTKRQNCTIAVFPPPLSPLPPARPPPHDISVDEEPLVPTLRFNSRNYFYSKLGSKSSWWSRWDISAVLDADFLVWLHRRPLEDRSPDEANAEKFWSSRQFEY
jgi:hypothetical protein